MSRAMTPTPGLFVEKLYSSHSSDDNCERRDTKSTTLFFDMLPIEAGVNVELRSFAYVSSPLIKSHYAAPRELNYNNTLLHVSQVNVELRSFAFVTSPLIESHYAALR
ncbi:hypothetical protein J6590_097433 [Homalodisca vitripennis]|nr:hypothetical protein J6590_097433 [Homalodisca vitripennis]